MLGVGYTALLLDCPVDLLTPELAGPRQAAYAKAGLPHQVHAQPLRDWLAGWLAGWLARLAGWRWMTRWRAGGG